MSNLAVGGILSLVPRLNSEVPEVFIEHAIDRSNQAIRFVVTCNALSCPLTNEPARDYDEAEEIKAIHESWHAEGMPD